MVTSDVKYYYIGLYRFSKYGQVLFFYIISKTFIYGMFNWFLAKGFFPLEMLLYLTTKNLLIDIITFNIDKNKTDVKNLFNID